MLNEELLALLVCPMGKCLRREGDVLSAPLRPAVRHQERYLQHADRRS